MTIGCVRYSGLIRFLLIHLLETKQTHNYNFKILDMVQKNFTWPIENGQKCGERKKVVVKMLSKNSF